MKRVDSLLLRLAMLAVLGTGVFYAWMRWFAGAGDPGDPEAAIAAVELEGHAKRLHLLAAAAAVFALGLVWRTHVLAQRGEPRGRRSGVLLAAFATIAAASGYVLQAIDGEAVRAWLGIAHGIAGGGLLSAYVAHRVAVARQRAVAARVSRLVSPVPHGSRS